MVTGSNELHSNLMRGKSILWSHIVLVIVYVSSIVNISWFIDIISASILVLRQNNMVLLIFCCSRFGPILNDISVT